MLDGLLGRGFSSKCKSSIKLIKARIDVIRRKRNAMQKYLKKDIADLLANNLETNAFGRAEGLIVELNLSFCYDLVEQFCGIIPRHLSVMQKQSVCPEEVREAVSSLMFAAARFADLPELRDLRQMFTERYGNDVEPFVNQEFKEKLSSTPPTVDQKLQLMRDIAKEYSVKWDSKDFQLKLSNPVVPVKDQPRRVASFQNRQSDGNKSLNNRETETPLKKDPEDVLSHGRREVTKDVLKPQKSIQETGPKRDKEDSMSRGRGNHLDNVYKARTVVAEETVAKKDYYNVSSRGRQEVANDGHLPQRDKEDSMSRGREKHLDTVYKARTVVAEDTVVKQDHYNVSSHGRPEVVPQRDNEQLWSRRRRDHTADVEKERGHEVADKVSAVKEKEKDREVAETAKPQYKAFAPPPYVKQPNVVKNGIQNDTFGPEKTLLEPPVHRRYMNVGSERSHDERQEFRPAKVNHVNEHSHHDDSVSDRALKPKPMSVRRRQMKPPLGYENPTSIEGDDPMRRVPSARRREARNGLQHALDDDHKKEKDEEELAMDQLLMHYSKKPTKYEPIMVKTGLSSNVRPSSRDETERQRPSTRNETERRRRPFRATSLPPEPATPPKEAGKAPSRATSFQPERLFVHPNLPEYDDLAARIASLRER
ncbi:hypothetical protein C5167_034901 [Papaver somniferum]|uniref:IST1-like protein n=1 Tax=Papaver somniferum TaxID=3469 RepID=A0A4Y7KHU4_PAPSO|nr:uncharacterized protein LOC113299830 [Papaver somniferum]RZC71741.1 hypothetical protein C5167_034901 [Papaver somniferum]